MDTLIAYGGEIKSLGTTESGGEKIGGYLVEFGTAETHDASPQRDFFDAKTDFNIEDGAKTAVYYHHGLDKKLGTRKLATGTLELKEAGVWFEAELQKRDAYEENIVKMVKAGKLGLSSGTAPNLVSRTAVKCSRGVAHHIDHWPLGLDASLTPTPANPSCSALSIKALMEPGEPEDNSEIKAVYLGQFLEGEMTMAALSRLNDAFMYSVARPALSGDRDYGYRNTPFEREVSYTAAQKLEILRGALAEYSEMAMKLFAGLIDDPVAAQEATKSIEQLWSDPDATNHIKSLERGLRDGLKLSDHSAKVLAANAEFNSRAIDWAQVRSSSRKSGQLSPDSHAWLLEHHDSLVGMTAEMKAKLDEHAPAAAEPADDSAEIEALEISMMQQESKLNDLLRNVA